MTEALAPPRLMAVSEAQRRLLSLLRLMDTEEVPLDAALGRVLAADVHSFWQIPGCDNSAMDGYAVRAADCAGASAETPVLLRIADESRAGRPAAEHVPGTATAISTGAALPRGADSIVRLEDTVVHDGHVQISSAVMLGGDVRRAGEDVKRGARMVAAGKRLRAVDVAACAAAGAAQLTVRRRPRVAVLSGGDELVAAGTPPEPHQVVDTNAPMLRAAIREAGGDPVGSDVMADEPATVAGALRRAAQCDLVVSSAGVSVGAHDHIHEALAQLGTIDVWRIAVRPGKPLLIGRVGNTPFIGLPGNPVSSAVTFELFVRPAVLAMQGAQYVHRNRFAVRLAEEVKTPRDLETYLRVRLEPAPDLIPVAHLSGAQGSSMLRSLSDAGALAVIPAGVSVCAAGTVVAALEIS